MVSLVRRHRADAGMVMILIVPMEKAAAEDLGILDAAKTLRMPTPSILHFRLPDVRRDRKHQT